MIGARLRKSNSAALTSDPLYRLKPREIEKIFTQVVYDLNRILIFDGIDMRQDGFRIRSHDLYGPLPVIEIEDTEDRYPVIDKIADKTAQLCAIVRMRAELQVMFPGCEFLPPTKIDNGYHVGLKFQARTILAEDRTYWQAYQKLKNDAPMIL